MKKEIIIPIMDRYKRKQETDYLILIPILNDENKTVGYLHPVTKDYKQRIENCVSLFSQWRKENPTLSPARFEITDERTDNWLKKVVVDNDNRILFIVQDTIGTSIGHIGFASFRYDTQTAEVDSVLKGVKTGYPCFMEYAMKALLKWGKEVLEIEHFDLEVIWDNDHAIRFYERCGFEKDHLIALEKEELSDEIRWVVSKDQNVKAEMYYQHMIWKEA